MYTTNITDSKWEVISTFFDNQRKRKYPLRFIVNVIFYLTRNGVQWRMLPGDLQPYGIVHYYFRKWQVSGPRWYEVSEDIASKNHHPVLGLLILNRLKTGSGVYPIKVLMATRK
jgi:hypothetical protein